jgi:hypothetical protein
MIPGSVGRERGQTAPLGVALLFAVVIIGTVAIVVFGGVALEDTESQSQVQRSEQVLTLFDSRTAMVALGDSSSQTTTLAGTGTYNVSPDAGRIRLLHTGYNSTSGPNNELIYDRTMGALTYQQGAETIAYEGGGVWRKGRAGNATMITPPEFYFRRSTLTFPLIRIANGDSASGSVTAEVTAQQRAKPIYPNRTAKAAAARDGADEPGAPYDPVSGYEEPYANPLENGTMVVFVTSDYYTGWAEYFRTRTEANVTTFPSNDTVKANLVSLGERGYFPMPQEGNGITIRGLQGGGHSLQEFNFTITEDDQQNNANLNNLQWSLWAESDGGQNQLEIHLKKSGGGDVLTTFYFSEDGGDTYEAWESDTAFTIENGDLDGDGDTEEYVVVDMTSDAELEYQKISQNSMEHFDSFDKNDLVTSDSDLTWDEHQGSVGWEPRTYETGDEETVGNITAHYFERMGAEFTLTVDDKQSNSVNENPSYGRIDYPGSARYIAYLHVTENEVTVDLEG